MNVSLVIPSRGRPEHLKLVLSSLRFQRDVSFEVIVVSDMAEAEVRRLAPKDCRVKYLACDEANLSKARNLGIAASGSEIIAFCDDDAIPEPNWLARLTTPFSNPDVRSCCGFVRGRNGVSYQWKAMVVDAFGNDQALDIEGPTLSSEPIKTVGTNSAFRKSALLEVGGFDEAFRFFLEDADINRRLMQRGGQTVIMPDAEVHHAFAPSAFRYFNRVPKSLFEIGASKAHFCATHGHSTQMDEELAGFRAAQKERLIRFHDLGLLAGADIAGLLSSLEDGFVDGISRDAVTPLAPSAADFVPFADAGPKRQAVVLKAGFFGAKAKKAEAARLAADGIEVALIQFAYSTRKLSVRFVPEGYWVHRGGVFGQGLRSEPRFRFANRETRLAQEAARLASIRTNRTN